MGVSAFVLWPAEFLSLMESINEANLPYTVGLRHGTIAYQPGGVRPMATWDGGDPTWIEPARVNIAGAPQEKLTAGSMTSVNDFTLVMRKGVIVPANSGTDLYRLEWTHDIVALASPFMLYDARLVPHSFATQSKYLVTSVAPQ